MKKNNELSPGARKAKQEYQRAWRAKNRDKQREYLRRFWEKKAREIDLNNNNQKGEQT